MHSIAFRMLVENIIVAEEQQFKSERVSRRQLRDASNPLELPQSL